MRQARPAAAVKPEVSYRGHRFPRDVIAMVVWLYYRFPLSLRMVEEMLAARGVEVTYETVRCWAAKFGQNYARRIRLLGLAKGDKWHLDEMVVKINGRKHWLWRAVDQHSAVLDVLVQSRRDTRAVKRLMRKLLKKQGRAPRVLVTDKLRSYGAANRAMGLPFKHRQRKGLNNRAEDSHQPMRVREKVMRRFKSPRQPQRFTAVHDPLANLFMHCRYHTEVIDLDPQSNVAFGLGVSPAAAGSAELLLGEKPQHLEVCEGLRMLPGSPKLIDRRILGLEPDDLLDAVSGFEYDVVIFDCPPGEPHLERLALTAANISLVVADAHLYALVGAERVLEVLEARHKKRRQGSQTWAIVMSRVDKRRAAGRGMEVALQHKFPEVKRLEVRQDAALAGASMGGTPVTAFAPTCRGVENLQLVMGWLDGQI